jgi:small subunit ribosomal protein S10
LDSSLENTIRCAPLICHSIGLPLHQSLYTVIRSPHIDKKSREQFTLKVHKQLIIINTEVERIPDVLASLKFNNLSGVQMKIIFEYRSEGRRLDRGSQRKQAGQRCRRVAAPRNAGASRSA